MREKHYRPGIRVRNGQPQTGWTGTTRSNRVNYRLTKHSHGRKLPFVQVHRDWDGKIVDCYLNHLKEI